LGFRESDVAFDFKVTVEMSISSVFVSDDGGVGSFSNGVVADDDGVVVVVVFASAILSALTPTELASRSQPLLRNTAPMSSTFRRSFENSRKELLQTGNKPPEPLTYCLIK